MDKNINYYKTLGVDKKSNNKEIKKAYYALSFINHPDKGGDPVIFSIMTEAYNVLMDQDVRSEYDLKSKFGNNYDEHYELYDMNIDLTYDEAKAQLETFKRNQVNNIQVSVDDTFNGTVIYERWVKCKPCDGSGKDLSSKIIIRDNDGKILKIFDSDDGCDFCEGSGESHNGGRCNFCQGQGKVGIEHCQGCKGEGRIRGRQKLTNIKLTGEETKLETMGNYSKNGTGYLIIKKEEI